MPPSAPATSSPAAAPPPAADIDSSLPTRERLVLAALHLFWAQGYAATSLAQILHEAGANAGSLHHFFPTKDALLAAVIDQLELIHTHILKQCYPDSSPEGGGMFVRSTNVEGAAVRTDLPSSPLPQSEIRNPKSDIPPTNPLAIFHFYRDFLLRGDCALGCPILNLACELSDSHPAVRIRLDRLLSLTRTRIASTLVDHPYPELLALLITTALHGALIHARTAKSTAPLEAAEKQLQVLLLLPPRPVFVA